MEFPNGEMVWHIPWVGTDPELVTHVRAQDTVFLLEQLVDPTVLRQIPGLGNRGLDTSHVGMFGHSIGGAATLEAMGLDSQIVGGVNLDGTFQGKQMLLGMDRPFLLICAPAEVFESSPAASSFGKTWPHLTGWKAALKIASATHMSFADYATFFKLPGVWDIVDPNKKMYGTIDLRMQTVQMAYLKAFFDFMLKEGSDQRVAGNQLGSTSPPRIQPTEAAILESPPWLEPL